MTPSELVESSSPTGLHTDDTTPPYVVSTMEPEVSKDHACRETATADVSLECNVFDAIGSFEQMESGWNQFDTDPMNSFAWHFAWWKAFQTSGDLHLLSFQQGERLAGVAPFYTDRWFGLGRLRFLASGNTCSDYADLIGDPAYRQSCTSLLAEYIQKHRFPVVELECMKDQELARHLETVLQHAYRFDYRESQPTWRRDLPDTWDGFVASTKKSCRRKIKKAVKRLDSKEFLIQSTSTDLDPETGYEILKDLHTRRFNSMDKPGVFADPRFDQFLRSAFLNLCRQERCEIVTAATGGTTIAAQLYLNSANGFQLYQSGYDPAAMNLEPGHLMFTAMVRKAIDRGDCYFDFLQGNESYKEYWGATPCPQHKLRMISKQCYPSVISKLVDAGRRIVRGTPADENLG